MRKTALGFTLVELLVVIAIIAILTGVSVSVFSTAQKSARDSRRKQEISTIAKSLEANKNFSTGLYKYTATVFNNDFPTENSQPNDPLYCIWGLQRDDANPGSRKVPPSPPTASYTSCTGSSSPCEGVEGCVVNNTFQAAIALSDGALATGKTESWTLCADLENDVPFCRSSMSR